MDSVLVLAKTGDFSSIVSVFSADLLRLDSDESVSVITFSSEDTGEASSVNLSVETIVALSVSGAVTSVVACTVTNGLSF